MKVCLLVVVPILKAPNDQRPTPSAHGAIVELIEFGFALQNSSAEDDDLAHPNWRPLWEANKRPEHSKDYYNFTLFAVALNELPEGEELQRLPKSDCRFRPDIRKLEEGDLGKQTHIASSV